LILLNLGWLHKLGNLGKMRSECLQLRPDFAKNVSARLDTHQKRLRATLDPLPRRRQSVIGGMTLPKTSPRGLISTKNVSAPRSTPYRGDANLRLEA